MAGQLSGKGLMKNMVTASVRGRVGDDITQCQDDEGSVRNCSNLDTFYFWNKFLVQIPWKGHFKSGKSSVLQARNESFVRRGFRRKVLFSFQAQSCPRLFRTLPFTLLRQTAAYKYILPIFSEILSAVFMCIQLPGNRVFNQSHCLFKVCVPAKEDFFFAGFLPSASQTHRGCGQSFAILGAFLALVVRSMTYVWKCKRTCSSVA